MKRKAKSVITILLTALMIITMLPTTAFAASSKKAPSKVSITKVTASTNAVTVKWKKASNATSYRIYYKQSGAKKWKTVANVSGSKTSYTHKSSKKTPLVGGKKYVYTVRAYNKSSKKWGKYNTKGKTVTIPAVPSTVKMGKVKGTAYNKVSISWSKASNATMYRVYYKQSGAKKWKAVANVSGTRYTHTSSKKAPLVSGKKYVYTVRAYNKSSKKWGKYNTKGVSVTVPKKNSTPAKVLVQSVDIDSVTTAIESKGGTYQFTSKVLPANATNKTLKWTSSNPKVATVDQNGKVTGISEGRVTITAEATDGSGKKDSAPMSVNFHIDHTKIPATGIKISKTSAELSGWRDSTPIEATLTPSNTTDWVEWDSSNSDVAYVNNGKISAGYPGTATLTAYVANNPSIKATCTVTVDYIQSVTINNSSIQLTAKGATQQISTTITPANTKHNALSWSSDDTSVATVDQNGKVTAVGNGYATITCKATDTKQPNNPDLTATCSVTVKIPEATVTPTPTPNPSSVVETVNLAGGKAKTCFVTPEDIDSSVVMQNVEMTIQGNTDVISLSGKGYNSNTGCSYIGFRALKTGQVNIIATYNGRTLKRWNVNVTSNWSEYMGYVAWRKDVESQIWNGNMSTVQKLDTAKDYIKTTFKYKLGSDAAVYSWKSGNQFADCITASEFMGDFAKDLGLKVYYVNITIDQRFDYIVDAYSKADGHILNVIIVNDQALTYDAQPPVQ